MHTKNTAREEREFSQKMIKFCAASPPHTSERTSAGVFVVKLDGVLCRAFVGSCCWNRHFFKFPAASRGIVLVFEEKTGTKEEEEEEEEEGEEEEEDNKQEQPTNQPFEPCRRRARRRTRRKKKGKDGDGEEAGDGVRSRPNSSRRSRRRQTRQRRSRATKNGCKWARRSAT